MAAKPSQTVADKKAARSAAAKKAAETRRINRDIASGDLRATGGRAWVALRDLWLAVRVAVEDRTKGIAPPHVVWAVIGVVVFVLVVWIIRS